MQRISDSVTTIFQLDTKEERIAACLQSSSHVVYSEKFGLGWRFGLQYAKEGWAFAKVKVYLDHTHCSSETDAATVTVCLKDGSAPGGPTFDSKTVSITNFGHGPPALLGSFSPYSIASHPFLWFTVTTKVAFAQAIADPLADTASALRQSMHDGAFIHTKYYAMSKRRTWRSPGETWFVYANDAVLAHDVGVAPVPPSFNIGNRLLIRYESQSKLIRDAERYDYDLDSDIEEEEEEEEEKEEEEETPIKFPPYHHHYYSPRTEYFDSDVSDSTSSSALSSDGDDRDDLSSTGTFVAGPLPSPALQAHRMVLVRDTAFITWASYVYYCYTGQVSFYPLRSKDPHSRRDKTAESCSPKSMYRLAVKLNNTRLQALAFQAIKSSLSKSNILDEAFSWFTAQYDFLVYTTIPTDPRSPQVPRHSKHGTRTPTRNSAAHLKYQLACRGFLKLFPTEKSLMHMLCFMPS
ncbi:uncharacterized protein EDB91DRAFT_616130 [Suillus paluster]|uniref:uncharacterized protein n=1 Tax=Suillus paluster TaxID=48578 RepID=UPI001B87D13D|nr:uncharacterized protein EDB91DRAFT_616130 [Suillus paluster]KAG1751619.1 hypothetical protein EDB91DRAFT_616130 [Suillus paluster]